MTDPLSPEEAGAPADPQIRLAELEGEVAKLRDTFLRGQADAQNQQRRHQREREELRKFAAAGVLEDLLPALDSLSLGLESAAGKTEAQAVVEGFRLAVAQLRSILASNGLVEIKPLEVPFNPTQHEAVGEEASATAPEGHVLRVARSGWLLHERVIRPAAVFVSSGAAK